MYNKLEIMGEKVMKIKGTLLILALLVAMSTGAMAAEKRKEYKVLLPSTYNISGKSKNQMQAFTEEIIKAISDIVDADITLTISQHNEEMYIKEAMTKLLNKEVEFVGFSGDWYSKFNENSRKKFPVFFALVYKNNINQRYCFYVRKSDKIKTVEDLRGKKFGGYIFKDARYLLYKAGVDEPLYDFFGDFSVRTVPFVEFMTDLVDNKIDAFASWEFNVNTSMEVDPRFKNIVPIACDYYALNPFVLYRADMDPTVIEKAKAAIYNWKTDKRFEKFKMFFMMIEGGVAPASEKDLKHTLDIEELVKKGNWENERKVILKKYADK